MDSGTREMAEALRRLIAKSEQGRSTPDEDQLLRDLSWWWKGWQARERRLQREAPVLVRAPSRWRRFRR